MGLPKSVTLYSEEKVHMESARVVREDGQVGTVLQQVTAEDGQTRWLVAFGDGSRLAVPPDLLVARADGAYGLALDAGSYTGAVVEDEQIVIPVVAEELTVERALVERRKVRVHKRVETREELVDEPTMREEVSVERLPVNQIISGEAPAARYEEGTLVIPILEEIIVVEKRLLLREEVRISKQRRAISNPQRIVLRREVVELEEIALGESPGAPEAPQV